VLATQKPTTLGAAAGAVEAKVSARKPPWLAIAAGAVVVLGGAAVLIATLTRPEPSVSATRRTSRPTTSGDDGEPARPPRRPAAPAPGAGEDSPTPPPTAPTAPAAPEMVRIDIQGAPPGSAVLVDDRASELPVRLPRGSGNHRITLTPPGGKPRIIDVDGTRDRVIELTLEKPGARPPVAESPPPRPPRPTGGTKPAGGGTKPAGGGTKPAGGGTKPPTAAGGHQKPPDKDKKTEREAIIDI
jgi:translation initiation factor IF-2